MEFANASNCACANCNLSRVDPSAWTAATHIVGLADGKKYAMCGGCYEASQFQTDDDYFKWLNRSNKAERVQVDKICVTCLMENNNLRPSTDTHESIPVCKGCKEFFELQDTYLWGIEHQWVDQLYADARRKMRQGLAVEVVVYK